MGSLFIGEFETEEHKFKVQEEKKARSFNGQLWKFTKTFKEPQGREEV